MAISDPAKQLAEGAKILDPILRAHGFMFTLAVSGKGSGGCFAQGYYSRGDRVLELHYRRGLGIVWYRIGEAELAHGVYMNLLKVADQSDFLSSALDGTLDGFHKLRADLERFAADFLYGDGVQFRELAQCFAADPGMFSGFKALGRHKADKSGGRSQGR